MEKQLSSPACSRNLKDCITAQQGNIILYKECPIHRSDILEDPHLLHFVPESETKQLLKQSTAFLFTRTFSFFKCYFQWMFLFDIDIHFVFKSTGCYIRENIIKKLSSICGIFPSHVVIYVTYANIVSPNNNFWYNFLSPKNDSLYTVNKSSTIFKSHLFKYFVYIFLGWLTFNSISGLMWGFAINVQGLC